MFVKAVRAAIRSGRAAIAWQRPDEAATRPGADGPGVTDDGLPIAQALSSRASPRACRQGHGRDRSATSLMGPIVTHEPGGPPPVPTVDREAAPAHGGSRGLRLPDTVPMTTSRVASMHDAIADLVRDGDTVAIEGFTHLISFAAGHEIIRQKKRDLTLARLTPDLIYDQMIAAGVARKLIFSWLGNPGVGGLGAIRRRIESADPEPLEVEEYSHFGMVGRYTAGAANLPFYPIRSYFETDLPIANPLIREIESPYGDGKVFAVPPLKPDVAIVHAQRADAAGNTQVWGLLGCQKEAAFAAERVIVVVEELVDEAVIRADPNRTIIPGLIVDAVVVEPFGAHPSYVQGAYDRDNRFYLDWDAITRDEASIQAWLRAWVYDLDGRAAYVEKLGEERVAGLRPSGPAPSGSVNYGEYR